MTEIAPYTRANARRLRAELTPQQRKLWGQLRDLNHRLGLNFRRQAPVGRFIADFAEFGRKLLIEVDGGQHGGPEDAARDDWFSAEGFTILRFWNNDVDTNLEGVMQVVLDVLECCPPPPTPPHEGEGRGEMTKGRDE
jgi:very-short-patch-repair endonuclease